jgi:hypothetical protein
MYYMRTLVGTSRYIYVSSKKPSRVSSSSRAPLPAVLVLFHLDWRAIASRLEVGSAIDRETLLG